MSTEYDILSETDFNEGFARVNLVSLVSIVGTLLDNYTLFKILPFHSYFKRNICEHSALRFSWFR